MEKRHYIQGYTDDERKVVVSNATYAASDDYLKSRGVDVSDIMSTLSLLIEGYETPYGMELLSSVHYLAAIEGITGQPEMSNALEAWNDHKRASFPTPAVTAALERLKADGFI